MFILDTNVVSELIRPSPDTSVIRWVDDQVAATLYLSAISVAELRTGAAILPAGQRQTQLLADIDQLIDDFFAARILAFDEVAARAYATIFADRRAAGQPISQADCLIAAIARTNQMAVATRDAEGFNNCGFPVINPWKAHIG